MFIARSLHRIFAASVLFALVIVAAFMDSVVYAQSTGIGFTPRQDITVRAGSSAEGALYVTNLDKKSAATLKVRVVDFTAADQTGSAELVVDTSADPTPWSLRPFLKVPDTVVLQPGESKQVPYTIAIPQKQGAGSYYSVVQYTAEGNSTQQVTVRASGASMLFVTVPGKAREQLSLRHFGPYVTAPNTTNGSFRSLFIGKAPTTIAYVVHNNGSVAEMPAGSIEISNIFGKQVRLIKNANPKRNVALIGQERRIEVCVQESTKQVRDSGGALQVSYCKDPKLPPGIYKARLSVLYGINGSSTQEIERTAIFWYVPIWSIVALVIIVAFLAFGIFKLRTVYVRYRARTKA